MKLFNRIAIIGVGLIGGAIGLAVKNKHLSDEVVGIFHHASTLRRALRCKAIDRGVLDLKSGVKDADLVIIAAPVCSIPSLARKAISGMKKGAVITDVGSTKKWLVDNIEKMPLRAKPVHFVGSHPMAGSEHTGVEFAKADLLKNAPCIVTRTNKTDRRALKKVVNFWSSLGAKVKVMSPKQHDEGAAFISHLPHLVAFGVAGSVPVSYLPYAAEGFRDTTRVASSDPELWADIFLTNKKEILQACRSFEKYYKSTVKALSKDSRRDMVQLLKKAKARRDKLSYGK